MKDLVVTSRRNTFQLQNLPHCAIFKVFSYLTYNQVAQMRIVSIRLNKLCQEYLNHGVKSLIVNLEKRINQVNSMLPKRISLKDSHHLKDHSEILKSLKYNVDCVLDYHLTKYIRAKMICFFPGQILDEYWKILVKVNLKQKCPPWLETMQEIRDLVPFAVDHFKSVLLPILEKKMEIVEQKRQASKPVAPANPNAPKNPAQTCCAVQQNVSELRLLLEKVQLATTSQGQLLKRQAVSLAKQEKKLKSQSEKLSRQEKELKAIGKKMKA